MSTLLDSYIEATYTDPTEGAILAVDLPAEEAEIPENAPVATVPPELASFSIMERFPPSPREVARNTVNAKPIVRRPTLGLVGYEDRFSTLEIIARGGANGQGEPIEIFNSSYANARARVTTNFIIQQVQESITDSVSIVRTLGDWYMSDSGESPRQLSVTGVLFESKNFPWLTEWRKNYDRYLRPRQAIMRGAMVYLTVDDTMYIGYIMNPTIARDASSAWALVPFNFTMVLRNVVDVRMVSLFPDSTGSEGLLIERGSGDTFVDGIRVAVSQGVTFPAFEGDVGGTTTTLLDNPVPVANIPYGQLEEILQGEYEGQDRELMDIELSDPVPFTAESALLNFNIEHLVSLARATNASAGREVYDLSKVRSYYMLQHRANIEGLGLYDPFGPATYGLPTAYQSDVDARRLRQQREALDTMSDWFSDNVEGHKKGDKIQFGGDNSVTIGLKWL